MANEGPTNGGLLYHEVQESKLCAVHCANTLLQGPFFTEVDLATIASDLDRSERQALHREGDELLEDFLTQDSHNVSTGGDFSIQVLQQALKVWNLQIIPINSPEASASKDNPDLDTAFICHSHNHWFCIRKVNGEWYNFNSLYAAPEHLSKFYLSAFLDTLRGTGWSIFLVRGNFPNESPSNLSNHFGQWLTPEDAKSITRSLNESRAPLPGTNTADAVTDMDPELASALLASMIDYAEEMLRTAAEASAGLNQDTGNLGSDATAGNTEGIATDETTAESETLGDDGKEQ